jgi:hypothetical protein
LRIPHVKPEMIAVINNAVITPPEIKVIIPIPRKTYRVTNPIREIINMLSNMAFKLPMLN